MTNELQKLVTWTDALDDVLENLEGAEIALSNEGAGRKSSGSYYTPADVADHFWRLFWRHHQVTDKASAVAFVDRTTFVEPSIGAGMFFFSLLRSLSNFGIGPTEARHLKFDGVDLNRAALDFVAAQIADLERIFEIGFKTVNLEQADFLKWVQARTFVDAAFVGNPPFVTNERGSRWKNLYADFLDNMLLHGDGARVGLILPVSVCFSRDFVDLRRIIRDSALPLSASSYDNMPDYLFKAGKPESGNTNKANSQRCTILNLGGPRDGIVESSALLRWSSTERATFMASTPQFYDCRGFDLERQIPRPVDQSLACYLEEASSGKTVREFMSRIGRGAFAVGAVARNFIGIREYEGKAPGVIPVKTNDEDTSLILLQVLASDIFYKYWRSFGDGFHVTNDLIDRFPISKKLTFACEKNLNSAAQTWASREEFAKIKLNSGKKVKSYDFSSVFARSPTA
ncbi:hypothetical protein EDF58_11512 [Novosphingobium sp. PhB57]|uniref:hypothetical protein n=1 Tax=Novosphingobium sp. PhB57 TaxID=2485107 RepID=UPI001043345F|nr:hypothetical protein [Novosphingobium sp. PhB57]TCU52339.1 hypothetical protein EDF58_11512 [Novosphingobium sp. PhB57]